MKLDKAIELGTEAYKLHYTFFRPDFHDALKLLIEAAKIFNDTRVTINGHPVYLLPGETED